MNTTLPPLREDLQLHRGPDTHSGYPSYRIYDPVRHQYFSIGWADFEIISRWHLSDPKKILRAVNQETTLTLSMDTLEHIQQFLTRQQLLQDDAALKAIVPTKKTYTQQFSQILFLKIRLCRPDQFFTRTLPWVRFLFHPYFYACVFALLLIELYALRLVFDQFIHTFSYFFNITGLVYFLFALMVSKIIHECGHAYTCKYFGARIAHMGVALLVFWPVLYTDTTDAWKISHKHQRLRIDAAGMIAEILLAIFATGAWLILDDGVARSICFFLASSAWLITLFINLNPFLRFDGYYLLSDLIDTPNLQSQSFQLTRIHLRNLLFGLNDPYPLRYRKKRRRLLILYGYATWLYRFFLLIGIALLIYYLFFKLLAVLLITTELILLIGMPIVHEIKSYWERRSDMQRNFNTMTTSAICAGLLIYLVIPWHSTLQMPAVLEAAQFRQIYTPLPGEITKILVRAGDPVKKDQILAQMTSPSIAHEIQISQLQVQKLELALVRDAGEAERLGASQTTQAELNSEKIKVQNLLEEQNKLTLRAPIAGIITQINPLMTVNRITAAHQWFISLRSQQQVKIQAYSNAADRYRIAVGNQGIFYPNTPDSAAVPVTVEAISPLTAQLLTEKSLSATFGGPIAVFENPEDKSLVIKDPHYRVALKPDNTQLSDPLEQPGVVKLKGIRRSWLSTFWHAAATLFIQESGF